MDEIKLIRAKKVIFLFEVTSHSDLIMVVSFGVYDKVQTKMNSSFLQYDFLTTPTHLLLCQSRE